MSAPSSRVAILMLPRAHPALRRRALASVAAQGWTDWTLYWCDADAEGLESELSVLDVDDDVRARIEVLPLAGQGALPVALAEALESWDGDVLAFLDAGDHWEASFLQDAIAALDADPDLPGVVVDAAIVDEEVVGPHVLEGARREPAPDAEGGPLAALLARRLSPSQLVFRRTQHEIIGGFHSSDGAALGRLHCLRLLTSGSFGRVASPLAGAHRRPLDAEDRQASVDAARARDGELRATLAREAGGVAWLSHELLRGLAEVRDQHEDAARAWGRLEGVPAALDGVQADLTRADDRWEGLDARLAEVDRRFNAVSEHLGHLERLIVGLSERVEARFDATSEHLGHLERRIDTVEAAVRDQGVVGFARRVRERRAWPDRG